MLVIPLVVSFLACLLAFASAGNFKSDVDITWGHDRVNVFNAGRELTLSLDKYSGSGFQSKHEYLFGRIDMYIKLVANNSAGTVTTYYLSSQGNTHDEVDFEFLGNVSGQPYTVHTNVYAQGKGNREQQFHLWFNPTTAFHKYTIIWNAQRIIWMIDNIPIRAYNNNEDVGAPFPKNQPMKVYSSLWNADDWATQGGRVKTDWAHAPFTASYRNLNIDGDCVTCGSKSGNVTNNNPAWRTHELDGKGRNRIRWVHSKYLIYNYCADKKRFPQGLPPECKRPRF